MIYLRLFAAHLKKAMSFRANLWLGAAFSCCRVLLSYLLFSMIMPGGGSLKGFTLPELLTYSLIVSALSPMIAVNAPLFEYADDIRTGRFARYLTQPVSTLPIFGGSYLAATLPDTVLTALMCGVWGLLLRGMAAPLSLSGLLRALPILALSGVFLLLLNYLIASLAFRFTDVTGFVLVRGTLLELFTGTLAPLEMLFGGAPVWSPLYYAAGYPALVMMGREPVPVTVAALILLGYTALLAMLCAPVARAGRRLFEGVGA